MDLKISTDGENFETIICQEESTIDHGIETATYLGIENGFHCFQGVLGIYTFQTTDDIQFEVGKMYEFKIPFDKHYFIVRLCL